VLLCDQGDPGGLVVRPADAHAEGWSKSTWMGTCSDQQVSVLSLWLSRSMPLVTTWTPHSTTDRTSRRAFIGRSAIANTGTDSHDNAWVLRPQYRVQRHFRHIWGCVIPEGSRIR